MISPFKSLPEVARYMFPMIGNLAKKILEDTFDSFSIIKQVESPILFLHGSSDKVVPKEHSKELYCKPKLKKGQIKALSPPLSPLVDFSCR